MINWHKAFQAVHRLYETALKNKLKLYNQQINKMNTHPQQGFIYMISSPTFPNWIKIGVAKNLTTRLASFNSSNPLQDFKIDCFIEATYKFKTEGLLLMDIDNQTGLKCQGEWIKVQDKALAKKIFTSYEDKDVSLKTYLDILHHKHIRYPDSIKPSYSYSMVSEYIKSQNSNNLRGK